MLSAVELAISDLRAGGWVVVTDEDGGDLLVGRDWVTARVAATVARVAGPATSVAVGEQVLGARRRAALRIAALAGLGGVLCATFLAADGSPLHGTALVLAAAELDAGIVSTAEAASLSAAA